jgi:hypothetical protein
MLYSCVVARVPQSVCKVLCDLLTVVGVDDAKRIQSTTFRIRGSGATGCLGEVGTEQGETFL